MACFISIYQIETMATNAPSTPKRFPVFSFGTGPQTFGTPAYATPSGASGAPAEPATPHGASAAAHAPPLPSVAPKYSEAAMRMGIAKSAMPASFARPVAYKGPINNNVTNTRVLGAFNDSTGRGWVESNGAIKQYRKGRKASRRKATRRNRKATRRSSRK